MTREQEKAVVAALVAFILRVTDGKTTSETETAVLPDVVLALSEITGAH